MIFDCYFEIYPCLINHLIQSIFHYLFSFACSRFIARLMFNFIHFLCLSHCSHILLYLFFLFHFFNELVRLSKTVSFFRWLVIFLILDNFYLFILVLACLELVLVIARSNLVWLSYLSAYIILDLCNFIIFVG